MCQTYIQSQEIQTLTPVKRKCLDLTTPEKCTGHFQLAFSHYVYSKTSRKNFLTLIFYWDFYQCKMMSKGAFARHSFCRGTALQTFGTRADSFGHDPRDLLGKACSSFFNVDFRKGSGSHMIARTSRGLSGRAVEKENGSQFVAS